MTSVDSLIKSDWGDWYEVNAMEIAKHCLARGRYEIASEFHKVGIIWYERHVLKEPGNSAEDRKRARLVLADYKDRLPEFPLLVRTRERLLTALNSQREGIDRSKLKGMVGHDGATAFGVICNQLDRGGWLRQEKAGKAFLLYPIATSPMPDGLFLQREIPTPNELEEKARVTPPIETLNIRIGPEKQTNKQSGCLPSLAALVIVGIIWLLSKG